MNRRADVGAWCLAIFGSTAAALLANAYTHFEPFTVVHRPTGSIVAFGDNGDATIIDVGGGRAPASITIEPRLTSLTSEPGAIADGIKAVSVGFPSWDEAHHVFWAASTVNAGKKFALVDSDLETANGRGEVLRYNDQSRDETLSYPTASPSGEYLAYYADPVAGGSHLSLLNLATGSARRLSTIGGGPISWSRDSRGIVYSCYPGHSSPMICIYDITRNTETELHVAAYSDLLYPALSPDGHDILVYGASGPDITEVLLDVNAQDGKVVWADRDIETVSYPVWSPDGRFIAFQGPNGVDVCTRHDAGCHLVLTGRFGPLQWTADALSDFGFS